MLNCIYLQFLYDVDIIYVLTTGFILIMFIVSLEIEAGTFITILVEHDKMCIALVYPPIKYQPIN